MDYHVSKKGDDAANGSERSPFLTIQHAADLAQPGDTVTVHEGIYRERVNPPRGGTSDEQRITYQAAPDEKVVITGAEIATDWERVQEDVWKTRISNDRFGKFNPYKETIHGDWFSSNGRVHHPGAVYVKGHWLTEAKTLESVLGQVGQEGTWDGQPLLNVAWLKPGIDGSEAGRIPATASTKRQGPRDAPCEEGGTCIGYINPNHWVLYEGVECGEKTENLQFRAASRFKGGLIEIRQGTSTGALLGTCSVSTTGGWQKWETFNAAITPISGLQTLCLVFNPKPDEPDPADGTLWFGKVDDTHTTLWAQFKGVNPNEESIEINARQSVFYPDQPGRNFITVRGFTLEKAATPWAPPTAEQIGLIGTHWSKGWIIENNTIAYSACVGVTLGKYGDEFDNKAGSATGYNGTITRALAKGWNKENIGSHIVRNNEISHCEQAGIVGSLGAVFSTIDGNEIHDIHVRRLFSGCEQSGIKLHASIDVIISNNHIYRTNRGLWLDWMAQGTRVTRNLFHDNATDEMQWSQHWEAGTPGGENDMFFEVNHGPVLVDNNIFLSAFSLNNRSQGIVFAHNIFAGAFRIVPHDGRETPFHKPHSTEVVALHDNPGGDNQFYNNIFVQHSDLSGYDAVRLPVVMAGNVFLDGAKPSKHESNPLVLPEVDPELTLVEKPDGFYLQMKFNNTWANQNRLLVTSKMLGKAIIPDVPYEDPDGKPYRLDTDFFGNPRNPKNPMPGPFEQPADQRQLKVWPVE